jgi:hypothetical protein
MKGFAGLTDYEDRDAVKKVNNYSVRIRTTSFTTLDRHVFLKPK